MRKSTMFARSAVDGFAWEFLTAPTPLLHACILKLPKPFVSPTYARLARKSNHSHTYAKTGGWGGTGFPVRPHTNLVFPVLTDRQRKPFLSNTCAAAT